MRIANLTARKIKLLKKDGSIIELKSEKINDIILISFSGYCIDGICMNYHKKEYYKDIKELEKIINYYIDNYDIVIVRKEMAEFILIKHLKKEINIKDINKICYPHKNMRIEKDGKIIYATTSLCPIAKEY